MNIEASIREEKYAAWVVLPIEFDADRTTLSFQFDGMNFYTDNNRIEMNVEPFRNYRGTAPQPETTQIQHASIIGAALKSISDGSLSKVVVSCIKHEPRKLQSLDSIFEQLVTSYPHACVFALSHPDHGIWMGATPELLLYKDGSNYRTVSLAGTQAYTDENIMDWSDKLKHEQSLVTDFIIESILKSGAMNIKSKGPYTSQAGPLAHLKTDILFTSERDSRDIIKELQPTPAVCGVPRDAARDFIAANSNFDRRLYSGRIGFKLSDNRELHFVSLRCMQLFPDHFEIHVGGGVVAQSNAEEEWNETEIKANVLRKFLH